jgi:serine/threonine protein kinase
MAQTDELREPLEVLAAEFMERRRSGEDVSIDEYTAKYPDLAAEIEELFPTVAMMEQLKTHKRQESGPRVSLGGVRLERLGDFLLLGEIGRGGMGIVYEAFQESLGRHVAVKVLPRQALLDSTQLQRFHREAQTAAKLHHTNIVPIFGVGEHEGYHYIVMQLIRGAGLDVVISEIRHAADTSSATRNALINTDAARLAHSLTEGCVGELHAAAFFPPNSDASESPFPDPHRTTDTPLLSSSAATEDFRLLPEDNSHTLSEAPGEPAISNPLRLGNAYWRNAATLAMQVADALNYAHGHHTLHRDIKPANLLLDSQGVVWITDFGLAKAMEQDNVTQAGGMVGTLRYMPPEQLSGKADARSDIYNLGLTLYELLALRPAFEEADRNRLLHRIASDRPPPLRKINPAIPRDLETIVLKAIAREPRDRYQTAGEMASDLLCYLEDRPIRARRSSLPERLWRWSRRNRAVAALTATTLLMLVAVAVVAGVGYFLTAKANIEETRQRHKAEETSNLAIDALDKIFRQFAPDRAAPASSLQMVGETGEKITVPVQPVLSRETAALLESMLVFYDRLARQSVGDVSLQRKVAEANRRVGDIRQRLGQNEESLAAYLRAAELFANLPDSDNDKIAEIARIHNELGTIYSAMNRHRDGYESFNKALATLKSIASVSDATPEIKYELARTYYLLGKMRGGPKGSPPLMMMFHNRGGPHHPGNFGPGPLGNDFGPPDDGPFGPDEMGFPPDMFFGPPPDFDQPPGDDGREPPGPDPDYMPPMFPDGPGGPKGPGGPGPGNPEDDLDNLQKAIELLEPLVVASPDVPDYAHLLARSYRELSQQRFVRGSLSASETANKATTILQGLVKKFPDVPDYRYDLAETYVALTAGKLSSAKSTDKDSAKQSQAMIGKALAISEELVAEHPNVPDYALSLAHIRLRLASLLWESTPAEAETLFRKAIEVQSTLVRRFPKIPSYKFGLAFMLDSLCDLLCDKSRWADARVVMEQSISILKESVEHAPDDFPRRDILSRNYRILSDILHELGEENASTEAANHADQLFPKRD